MPAKKRRSSVATELLSGMREIQQMLDDGKGPEEVFVVRTVEAPAPGLSQRCPWATTDLYERYHDTEWGVPLHDERLLFEFLVLEGAQAGLSWLTILKKRDNYRKAFANFDPQKVARFTARDTARLLADAGIVRNKLKIAAAIQNARAFLAVQESFGSFDAYIWRFVDGTPIQNTRRSLKDVPARTPISDAMSKDLKARGFTFVGSTICYAHMQATGMVNDHLVSCHRHAPVAALGRTSA